MLAGEIPLAPAQLSAVIRQAMPKTSSSLEIHLQTALEKSLPAIRSAHPAIIASARKKLLELPVVELGNVILKNMEASIVPENNLPTDLPANYQGSHFAQILDNMIPAAASAAIHGDAVLGPINRPANHQPDENVVTAQLRNQYLAEYAGAWEEQLVRLQPEKPRDLFAVNTQIAELANPASELIKKLQFIKENTAFDALTAVSPTLQALNAFLEQSENNPDSQRALNRAGLLALHNQLEKILASPNPAKSAFALATERLQHPEQSPFTLMHQLAKQNPEPIKTWLEEMTDTSWHFIFEKAESYASLSHMHAALTPTRPQMTPIPENRPNWLVHTLRKKLLAENGSMKHDLRSVPNMFLCCRFPTH